VLTVIAFGCAVTHNESYERFAAPGLALAREPDSPLLSYGSVGSVFANYNMLIDQAAAIEGVEALVIIHQDAEIVDPDFCRKLRESLADPEVAIVGCAGSIGARNLAWWEGSVTWASFTHRYWEYGGGEFPALSWTDEASRPSYARTGAVETIDGFVIALSPWALANLRFDEAFGRLHGYDFDICAQARAAGRKVVTADLRVVHHHSLDLLRDPESWIDAHIRIADKWEGKLAGVGSEDRDWKARARRAEAEAGAARLESGSRKLKLDAADKRIADLEADLERIRTSPSWRVTAPLRALRRRGG
jgi:GT2 family glycosyltransferase